MYRKILLAYDDSTFSAAVLRQGAELASLCQAELHLLSIVVTTGVMAIAEAVGPEDVWGLEQQNLQRVVAAAAQDLHNQGLTVIACIRYGDPAVEIAAYAREVNADLVVLGHTSKGMLTRWFQGSVGAKLLDHLPCSLLVATGRD
ncbi:universal stress protein family protein [mine drainage metagenome]|uniref:Universal stress protein family protein n=1 Tax=mine drainage metagenome TaxID=410659 RepID=A0A1J5R844_9ZZZZ